MFTEMRVLRESTGDDHLVCNPDLRKLFYSISMVLLDFCLSAKIC